MIQTRNITVINVGAADLIEVKGGLRGKIVNYFNETLSIASQLMTFLTKLYKAGAFKFTNLLSLKTIKYLKMTREENQQNLNAIKRGKDYFLYLGANEVDLAVRGICMQWRVISQLTQATSNLNQWDRFNELMEVQSKHIKMFRMNKFDWRSSGLILNARLIFSDQYLDTVEDVSKDYQKEFEKLWFEQ